VKILWPEERKGIAQLTCKTRALLQFPGGGADKKEWAIVQALHRGRIMGGPRTVLKRRYVRIYVRRSDLVEMLNAPVFLVF